MVVDSESESVQEASSSKKWETEDRRRRERGGKSSSSESEKDGVGGMMTEVGEGLGDKGVEGKEIGRSRKDGIGGGGVDGREREGGGAE